MSETKLPSFEVALQELQAIVVQLEAGNGSLEESLALYTRGQALAAHCSQLLEQAELRIVQIQAGKDNLQQQMFLGA